MQGKANFIIQEELVLLNKAISESYTILDGGKLEHLETFLVENEIEFSKSESEGVIKIITHFLSYWIEWWEGDDNEQCGEECQDGLDSDLITLYF